MREVSLEKANLNKLLKSGEDREICFLLLYEVLEEDAFSNLVIKQVDREAVKLNKSTAFIRAMLYGTITYSYSIDFLINHLTKNDVSKMDPALRTILRMAVWQIVFSDQVPDFAAVSTSVEIMKKYNPSLSGTVNAILHKFVDAPTEKRDISSYKPEIRTALKPEIYGILKKCYGKDRALSIGLKFLENPKLSIRFNPNRISREELSTRLLSEGFETEECSIVEQGLNLISGVNNMSNSKAFSEGLFFVQNQSAMIASIIAAPERGSKILDCCAAPGGKSTHLAEIMGDEGEILSTDISDSRLKLILENKERLGLQSIKTMVQDASDMSNIPDESFDMVICDVPCSGLGLLGRKPDIRQKITYDRMKELLPLQAKIMSEAAAKVKKGGTLVYCTCTINCEENENQVESFLLNHPDFVGMDICPFLPKKIIIDECRQEGIKKGYITLFPDLDGTDGFFVAKLKRI